MSQSIFHAKHSQLRQPGNTTRLPTNIPLRIKIVTKVASEFKNQAIVMFGWNFDELQE